MFLVIIHCIPPPYVGVRGGLLDDYPSSILNIHARLHRLRIKLHALEGEPGVVIIIKREKKEYEIEISNDLVDCAVIHGDNKRDDLVSFSLKECDYIGPVTSDRFNSDVENANYVLKMTDFKNFDIVDDYWYWAVTSEGLKLVVVFMYKDEMYQVFRRYNPRNTIPMNKLPKPQPKEEEDGGDK